MSWQFSPYSAPLFVAVAIIVSIVYMAWRHRDARGAPFLILASLGVMIYVIGYVFELGSTVVADVQFWLKVEYLGSTTAPAFTLTLVLLYTGRTRWQTGLIWGIWLILPAITIIFAWTNEQHELIWQDLALEQHGDQFFAAFTPGFWYWVQASYSLCLILAGSILVFRDWRESSGLYRWQTALIMAGLLIPLLVFAIYLLDFLPVPLDLNPYGLSFTALFVGWGMLHYGIMDIMPVARDTILTAIADAVIVVDDRDRIVHVNPMAEQVICALQRECIGRPADEVLPDWFDALRAARESQQSRIEISLKVESQPRFFDMSIAPLQIRHGRQQGYLTVLRDITSRVQSESALREAHQSLVTLRKVDVELTRKLEVQYVANIALDAAQRLSLADSVCIALVEDQGFRIVQSLGHYPRGLSGQLVPLEEGITGRVIRTGEAALVLDISQDPDYFVRIPNTRAQMTVPLRSGRRSIGAITLETADPARFTPEIFDTIKLLAARIATAIDNSNVYEERERLVKELRAFSHTVAHDLKNPLASVIGYAELAFDMLVDDSANLDTVKDFLSIIQRNGEKSVDIINALMLLAGVREQQAVELAPLAMGRIVEEARLRLAPQIEQHHGELIVPDHWLPAQGYGPWVEEIWANYISNAVKYGGRPPRIELGSDCPADGVVRFWVRDNGPGLSAEDRAKLFRPFARLRQSGEEEGHGLGLSIVQRIAERLKGQVGVESEPGHGSLFYFTLPSAS